MSLQDDIAKLAERKLAFVREHREQLITAWLAETGLLPSESMLVEKHEADGTTRVWVEMATRRECK